jgi:flavin reductase (DIM6/NTAB) family NADH-FMN oxidoreductase RutF
VTAVNIWKSRDIEAMPQRYRAMFINSLSGFKSANLLGTISGEGNENLCIVSSVFHIGADPALMGMITRPQTVRRDSVNNIKTNGFYTLNHVNPDIVNAAHQTSARYDEDISEFKQTGLTPHYVDNFPAPFVAESHLRIGLQMHEIKLLEVNNTELVIGEIQLVSTHTEAIEPDGSIDIETLQTVAVSGLDRYHSTKKVARLSYAKPDKDLEEIKFD